MKVPGSSIASRQLVDRSSFFSYVLALYLDTFLTATSVDVVFFDTFSTTAFVDVVFLDRCLDTYIYQDLLTFYIKVQRDPVLISLNLSLSIASCSLLPNLSHSLQTFSSRFLQAFTSFSSLGKLRISLFHAFSCFET